MCVSEHITITTFLIFFFYLQPYRPRLASEDSNGDYPNEDTSLLTNYQTIKKVQPFSVICGSIVYV